MKGIYNIRTLFEKYYSEYGNYIDAAAKFVTALILFMQINGRIGGKSIFGNIFVELILALVCAILPPNVMIVLAFVAALLQLRPYQSHRWQSEEAFCWQYCFYILHLHRDRHGPCY